MLRVEMNYNIKLITELKEQGAPHDLLDAWLIDVCDEFVRRATA